MNLNLSFFILQMIFCFNCINLTKSNIIKRNTNQSYINSIRVETSDVVSYSKQGNLTVKAEVLFSMRLFANEDLNINGQISFTNVVNNFGENCNDLRRSRIFAFSSAEMNTALVEVMFDKSDSKLNGYLMLCYRENNQADWIHQGSSIMTSMKPVYHYHKIKYILIIIQSLLIPICIIFSGLLSALALNLLSLTKSELRMLKNQGTSEEKKYSRVVTPLRRRGNVLFCSLLLMNTLVNVIIAVLFHDLISYWSILAATLLIVFLGEIIPQTICSRFGLLFGNKLAWLTNIIVVVTFPFSYPVSKLLDWMLNDEVPMVYNRDCFQELLAKNQRIIDNNLQKNKSTGKKKSSENLKVLKLSNKSVGDIMISLDETFMQEYDSVLDQERVAGIIKAGHTRVPIFKKSRSNVVALLHLKDLELTDPADLLILKTVCVFYNRPVNFVFEDTRLDVILEEFKKGQSHMAMVQRVNNEGAGDPYYETVGMVTLDDVITDVFTSDQEPANKWNGMPFDPNTHLSSNESGMEKMRLDRHTQPSKQADDNTLSPNQLSAIMAYLGQFPYFQSNILSSTILEKLLKQSKVVCCKGKVQEEVGGGVQNKTKQLLKSLDHVIVQKNEPLQWFVLVLEGRVLVEIGAENFIFTEKPFGHFGMPVLSNKLQKEPLYKRQTSTTSSVNQPPPNYIPDFSVRPDPDTSVTYLIIDQSDYYKSVQASLLKLINENPDDTTNNHLFRAAQNDVTDFVSNAAVSQQLQLEQQMQQQQQNLEQQLKQEQLQQELQQLREIQQQQPPYHPLNLFTNVPHNNNIPQNTPGNNIISSHTGGGDDVRTHGDEYDDDIEDYKDGLIPKANSDREEDNNIVIDT